MGVFTSWEKAVDMAAEMLERLMVITLISSRRLLLLVVIPLPSDFEDDAGIIAMMASPAWSVEEKLVS